MTAYLGQYVYVVGIYNFINIDSKLDYDNTILGSATPLSKIINEIHKIKPDIVDLRYCLIPKKDILLMKLVLNKLVNWL